MTDDTGGPPATERNPRPMPATLEPIPYVGVTELAEILGGITPQAANYFAGRPGFPAPVGTFRGSRVWDPQAVARWFAEWSATEAGARALARRAAGAE